ncbi:unnamed protein product [Heligmosomoides polygyrus]|uniref:Col_cuticle_N domain-containing protein n=1 Tax=Heligmosomoides polygyrus TaxID=6339 RepID=A0A183FS43_HELPZ|nr:unnamed protein product [Heligmosomoides polygyrus]
MSVQRTFLAAACGGSALAIVAALCMTVSILTDINSFYDVVITDMGEFKGYADDAWKQMVRTTGGDRHPFTVTLARARRDYQAPPNGVEAGPESGVEAALSDSGPEGGVAGAPGSRSKSEPGPAGPAGPPGPAGPNGEVGE